MSAFEEMYLDFGPDREISPYDSDGVRLWEALTRSPSYTPYRASHTSLAALARSDAWQTHVASTDVATIFDLGAGTGAHACTLLQSFSHSTGAFLVITDISQKMLQRAFRTVSDFNASLAIPATVVPVRNDFIAGLGRLNHWALRGYAAAPKRRVFCLLGGTLSNFFEDVLFDALAPVLRPGDIFVFGVELHKFAGGSHFKDSNDFLLEYSSEEHIAFCVNDCVKHHGQRPDCANLISVGLDLHGRGSSVEGTLSVVSRLNLPEASIELIKSHRYDEMCLLRHVCTRSFELVTSAACPANEFYKTFMFRRV